MTKQMCRIKDQIFCVGYNFYTKSAKRNNLWNNKHEIKRFEKYLMFNCNNCTQIHITPQGLFCIFYCTLLLF